MADRLWYSRGNVPGVGYRIEVWSGARGALGSIRFIWASEWDRAHVELSAQAPHATEAARVLDRLMSHLGNLDVARDPRPAHVRTALQRMNADEDIS